MVVLQSKNKSLIHYCHDSQAHWNGECKEEKWAKISNEWDISRVKINQI